MKTRNITDDYTAKSWKAGDKLLASDLTKMSTTLDAVENEVVDIETTALPTLTTRVEAAEAKIATLETAGSALDLPDGQTVTGYVNQKVADLVGSAPETLDTIAEVAAAIETNGDAIEAIQSLVTENGTAIDGVQTTVDELGARTETLEQTAVKFTEFQREQDETVRKTIQLDNFDSISGVTTTGAGVNLAMVSKWDKADFGSAQIPLNLNSKDGVVTINDGVAIATVDQIPSTEGFATTAAVDEKLAGKQDAGDYPVYQKFVAGADPAERKTIQLANADSISGVSTSGSGANLIMMSKWDKVDIGSVNYQMNLNSSSGVVQINDEKVVATTDQIPDVANFVTNETLQTAVDGKQDKGDYALKSEIPDVSDFVTTEKLTEQLTTKQDAGDYPVYKQFVAGASDKQRKTIELGNADSISGVMSTGTGVNLAMVSEWDKADFGSSQLPLNLNATDGIVTINDSKTVATVDQIPDVSALATKEAVAGLKVVDLGTFEKVENASYAAGADGVYNNKEAVVLTFDTAEGSGVIFNTMTAANSSAQRMYWNNQVLSRTVTDGSGTGWGVLSNFTELQNRAIKSTLFTLTTEADSETIKAAMTNENSKTITASDLDSCLKYGYTIRDYALQSGSIFVGWTGSAYTLTYIGFATPTSEPYVMSIVVNVTPQGEYSIVRNGTRGQILTSSNLASNKTFKELSDSVAGKAEAVHTHTIGDVTGLQDVLDGKQDKGDYATNEVVQAEFESYDKTIKAYVDSKLTAVYTYKGSVANDQALPAQDQTVGDVYNVEDTGKNVAWDGEKWDELGGTVDLSAYAKTENVNAQLATKANQAQIDTLASDVDNIGNVVIPQMNTNTAKALDMKVQWDEQKKVISLPVDGSISAMREADPEEGTQPEGGVLLAQRTYDEGVTLVTEVGTTKNKLTLNASERPQVDLAGGSSEKLAYQSELPALIKLPVRTGIGGFQDKLYTQEEIFAWFGVTDLSGFLALAKSARQVWISYVVGASFQTSAYRYLANYIEYVPDSQSITVIWVGPDSANADVISKFVFKANLDQTVIEGSSNVKLTITSLE